jgi:hypothetical protein
MGALIRDVKYNLCNYQMHNVIRPVLFYYEDNNQ